MQHEPIIIERTLHAPAAKVWKALTDITDLRQWSGFAFGPNSEFKPEVGFMFQFELGPDDTTKFLHHCEVTDVVEGKKLAYSWRYEGYEGDSVITYELFPEGDATKLQMTWEGTHSFPADTFKPAGFVAGANYAVDALQSFFETK